MSPVIYVSYVDYLLVVFQHDAPRCRYADIVRICRTARCCRQNVELAHSIVTTERAEQMLDG